MANIVWKRGSRVKANAEVAHQVIEQHRADNGGEIDPKALWLSQADEDAPLHDEYEWDKDVAWEKYNITRSNYIIRSLEIVYDESGIKEPVRAYESITRQGDSEEKPRRVYERTEDILADPEGRDMLLAAAYSDALAFRRRYSALSELSLVIERIDDFVAQTGS